MIPSGKITTYKDIAHSINSKAYRAIGNVLSKNINGYLDKGNVPCHRVISSDGSLGGFYGEKTGKIVNQKKNLLEKEGIVFDDNNKVVDFDNKRFDFEKMK